MELSRASQAGGIGREFRMRGIVYCDDMEYCIPATIDVGNDEFDGIIPCRRKAAACFEPPVVLTCAFKTNASTAIISSQYSITLHF